MPSPFAAALAKMDADLDVHMGEVVAFAPQASGKFAARPDPARPAFSLACLVHDVDPSTADIGSMESRVRYEEWELEIRREVLAGRVLRKGDRAELTERAHLPLLEVARIDDTDRTRLRLTLARLKPAAEV